jgi:hypothetical protein
MVSRPSLRTAEHPMDGIYRNTCGAELDENPTLIATSGHHA